MDTLRKLLEKIFSSNIYPPARGEYLDALVKIAHKVSVPAKETIFSTDGAFDQILLLEEGMVRLFVNQNDKECTVDFLAQGQLVWVCDSLATGLSNRFGCETLFPCTYYYWKKEDYMRLLEAFPYLRTVRRITTERRFLQKAERLRDLQSLSLKEHYQKLLARHGDLINNVPQYCIASYLGVKPQSLSRIKASLTSSQNKKDAQ